MPPVEVPTETIPEGRLVTVTKTDDTVVKGRLVRDRRPNIGLLVKAKARSAELILTHEIKGIEVGDDADALKQVTLKPVLFKDVKRHLLNYHGTKLSVVNGFSEQEAVAAHDVLHNESNDWGHVHREGDSE